MAMRGDMKPDVPAATVTKIILNYFLNSVKDLEALRDTMNQSIHLYNQEVW